MKIYPLILCTLIGLTACRKKEQKPEYKVNVQVKEVSDQDVPAAHATNNKPLPITQPHDDTFDVPEVPMPEEEGSVEVEETVLESISLDEQASDDSDDIEELDVDSASIVT